MANKSVLLVEGKDGEHVLYSLLLHHQVPKVFEVVNKEGIDSLLNDLDVEIDRSDLERLGIIVDADTDLSSRWQSLRDRLSSLGYAAMPDTPHSGGTIVAHEVRPVVGIWLMPDNTLPGMLEHFVSFLGAADDPLWGIADGCLNEIPDDQRRFSPNHRIKAQIHTWLAWQKEPGTPFGSAITKRYLDANAPHAQQLIAWIRTLFEL